MTEPWTLERELIGATGASDLGSALARLGLIPRAGSPYELKVIRDWYPSGSETYVLEANITVKDVKQGIVLKACVAMGDLTGVDGILSSWLFKRQILARSGVSVPYLYCRYKGSVLEERIPLLLRDAFSNSDQSVAERLSHELGRTIAATAASGFARLGLSDLRSRGSDVVVVDFGTDLGQPQEPPSRSLSVALMNEATASVSAWLGAKRSEALLPVFRSALQGTLLERLK